MVGLKNFGHAAITIAVELLHRIRKNQFARRPRCTGEVAILAGVIAAGTYSEFEPHESDARIPHREPKRVSCSNAAMRMRSTLGVRFFRVRRALRRRDGRAAAPAGSGRRPDPRVAASG